ncbi:8-amino-7-oxononanoate synthase [Streptomyces sp. DASNCL29]|uniref:8-amino-7-oxononanoate synthase n=1 Tax=Streptomyces sp. DASNCL29 TaxID=2583819 RepID=UPI00110FED98|nr:8-amino-7-oxononanoate synthase [Streptomyces sp. DASNCL29]TMV00037.1 8-amino-7-oxononanoate synthase [Streptomyces sp. DASNCL29]
MATVRAQPQSIEQGGRVLFFLTPGEGTFAEEAVRDFPPDGAGGGVEITWEIRDRDRGVVAGAPTVVETNKTQAYWDVADDQPVGPYIVTGTFTGPEGEELRPSDGGRADFLVSARPAVAPADSVQVHMGRTATPPSDDQALWTVIRKSAEQISFDRYDRWVNQVMCGGEQPGTVLSPRRQPLPTGEPRELALPFPGVDAYRLLKATTEVFLIVNCGVLVSSEQEVMERLFLQGIDLASERKRYGDQGPVGDAFRRAIMIRWSKYLAEDPKRPRIPGDPELLPYLDVIRHKLGDQQIGLAEDLGFGATCFGILRDKLTYPFLLELIWSYWHEEGMLVHSMDAIARRFQNLRGPAERDPLTHVEIDPLRPLNQLLWGYVQDEQHRLTALRRTYEYDHHYGITLLPPTVPPIRPADSRPRFLEAFHTLLSLTSVFFREDDDTTVIADGFPVLNAIKDVHLLLTEGQHNQYGDLPWNARMEMLMQQWLLARPEMREFLPGRTMVAYPERWMDRVDTMKRLQGWTPDTVIQFSNLGQFGEQILLSIRFGNWNAVNDRDQAANWARYWRTEIQGYMHAYRAVTGIDLTVERADARVDAAMPGLHLRRRLMEQLGRAAFAPAGPAAAPAAYRPTQQIAQSAPGRQLPLSSSRAALPRRRPSQLPPGTFGPPGGPGRARPEGG